MLKYNWLKELAMGAILVFRNCNCFWKTPEAGEFGFSQ